MKADKIPKARFAKQLSFLKSEPKAYGGDLLKTRIGRSCGRPLDTKATMHLILRSTKAKGAWSFWLPENKNNIKALVSKFSYKYGIKIISMANVGNHLHFQIKLNNRHTFTPFIRALTAAIAMAISGSSRWNPMRKKGEPRSLENTFWDQRPFTRVVQGYRNFLNLRDYIQINQLEGFGKARAQAKFYLFWNDLKFSTA